MNRKINLFFLLAILLYSCTVYKEYPIEIFKPGEIKLPENAKSAVLIYRNFKYPGDTLQHYYKSNGRLVKAAKDPENLDSIIVNDCLNQLSRRLKSAKSFSEVEILPYNLFKRHSDEKLPDIPDEITEKLANTTQADILISLEMLSAFYSKYPQNYDQPETNEVVTAAVWGIYDLRRRNRVERISVIDTIYQNGYDNEGNYMAGYKLPSRISALRTAARAAGEKYADRMVASWQTVDRLYSIPPLPDFSDAAYYFEEGKTEKAIALWGKYVNEKNGKLAINARFNLALAYEMMDDLEKARQWLSSAEDLAKSYNSKKELTIISYYKKELAQRFRDMQRLQ
ncbi:MAG: DUF6340 family protein [Prolixibacteraceae bacterium]|nr:DUF6340 family protein [Prolixibacteraceae bacterium]